MSSIFGCCLWPFLLGALLGWLANWLLCKCCCKSKPAETTHHYTPPPPAAPPAPPVAKAVDIPAATVAPIPVPVPVAKAAPAAKPKPKAKPKAPAKPKAVSSIDLAAAKAAGFVMKGADDLTVIEGIGPKINDLFKAAGLNTFAQVEKATVAQMRTILDNGGPRFRIANPGTWAQQAGLANSNKWTELKKLQDELSAGLKK